MQVDYKGGLSIYINSEPGFLENASVVKNPEFKPSPLNTKETWKQQSLKKV